MGNKRIPLFMLTERARKFVFGKPTVSTSMTISTDADGNRKHGPTQYHYGRSVKREKSGETTVGMNGEEIELFRYTFPDGKVYYERVQENFRPFSTFVFTTLQDEEGNSLPKFLWTEKQLSAVLRLFA